MPVGPGPKHCRAHHVLLMHGTVLDSRIESDDQHGSRESCLWDMPQDPWLPCATGSCFVLLVVPVRDWPQYRPARAFLVLARFQNYALKPMSNG